VRKVWLSKSNNAISNKVAQTATIESEYTGNAVRADRMADTERRMRSAERLLVSLANAADYDATDSVATILNQVEAHLAAAKEADDKAIGKDCPNCPNQGWYMVPDSKGDPTPEQCQWCYVVEDSKFNLDNKAAKEADNDAA